MGKRLPIIKAGPKFSIISLPMWVMWLMSVVQTHNYQAKILSSVPFDKKNPQHKIREKDRSKRSSRKEKSHRRKNAKAKEKSASKKRKKLPQHPATSSHEAFADSDSSQPTSTEVIHNEGKEGHKTVNLHTPTSKEPSSMGGKTT